MLISTTSGKVISISIEDYLSMSDAQYDALVYGNYGTYINDPFSLTEIEDTSEDLE